MQLSGNEVFRLRECWTVVRCCQAVCLALLISPLSELSAENGLVAVPSEQAERSDAAAVTDGTPTRLIPRWTKPRRAQIVDAAVAAEMTHAEKLSADYGETGSVGKPLAQPSMIDVVGAGLFISPITDENHQQETDEAQPRTKKLPMAVRQALELEDWTTAARIVVHSPDKDGRLPSKLNQLLIDSGASSVENHEVDMTVARDHIRFYHPSDHMYAIEVAAALDGVLDTLLVKDFSFIRPQPAKGLVEIWLR